MFKNLAPKIIIHVIDPRTLKPNQSASINHSYINYSTPEYTHHNPIPLLSVPHSRISPLLFRLSISFINGKGRQETSGEETRRREVTSGETQGRKKDPEGRILIRQEEKEEVEERRDLQDLHLQGFEAGSP